MPRTSPDGGRCNTSTHDEATMRRRRSLSVASARPSVETVVVKAKRAASTLWTLLHAQNCILADSCPHVGCREAKLLHLHLKTCPAGEAFSCPTAHHGCDQARKLMAHYRRCRKNRAKQVGNLSGRRDPSQQHVCLICSLVARQARSILDKPSTASSSSVAGAPRSGPSSTRLSMSVTSAKKTTNRKPVTSFRLDGDNMMMPPPPPASKLSNMPPPPSRSFTSSFPVPEPHKPGIHAKRDAYCQFTKEHPSLPMGSHDASASRRLVVSSPGARPRSASVGDTTLLFKSSSSPNFEPINEEEPSPEEEELQCGAARSFDFADMPC